MPLGKILPRQPSDHEIKIAGLIWPEDKGAIKRLTAEDFRVWVYSLNPRLALIITCTPEFREVLAYQESRSKIQALRDWVVRGIYGCG